MSEKVTIKYETVSPVNGATGGTITGEGLFINIREGCISIDRQGDTTIATFPLNSLLKLVTDDVKIE